MRNSLIAFFAILFIFSNAKADDISIGDCIVRDAYALTTEEIIALTQPIVDKGSFPTHCIQAAAALETAIRKTGAFAARVFIDAPEDSPNIVLRVVEGQLAENGVKLGRSSARVNDDVILGQTNEILKPGTTITAEKYERAILLLNDLPGIAGSENTIFPADEEGEAHFEVHPKDANLINGHIYADNYGSTFTGEYRLGAGVDINSPFGIGEKFTLSGNVSEEGTFYLSLDASMPITNTGLRGGIAIGALQYQTDESDGLEGYSRDASAYLQYPLIRSRQSNLYGELRAGHEDMKDETDTSTVTDRHVNTGHIKLSGDRRDGFGGGGTNGFSVEGVVGYVDLGDYEPFLQEDAITARTNGRFSRLAWNASRLQHLGGPWQSFIEVAGQFASKRLDSSQAIGFGGPYDFPGYHSGEVLGDEGYRLHADVRYNVPTRVLDGQIQASVFYDIGSLTTHAKAFAGNVITPGIESETYTLQSAGIGLSMTWPSVTVQGVVGRRISNEIPDTLLDGDPNDDYHGWLQAVYKF